MNTSDFLITGYLSIVPFLYMFLQCIFLQSVCILTNAVDKIHSMTAIKLLYVLAMLREVWNTGIIIP
jgi:hypothetical protein